jgi:signal transduction histidine kinase
MDWFAAEQSASKRLHDLSNVLFVISSLVEEVKVEHLEMAERQALIEEIDQAVRRACNIIRRKADNPSVAKPGTGNDERVRLGELLAGLRRSFTAIETNTVRVAVMGTEVSVTAPRAALEQAVRELVVNANEAIHGRGEITVAHGMRSWPGGAVSSGEVLPPGVYAAMSVQDSGDGTSRNAGRGLSIAREAARSAGGGVLVETMPGRGSRITLLMPAAE